MFSVLFPVLIILVAIFGIGIFLSRLYKRAPKSRAFVRTGLGGNKVVKDGGALVLPIFHEIMFVNLETLRLDITREKEQAVITADKMRADISVEFYLNVEQNVAAISQAAQTLGNRTMDVNALRQLIEGKFSDAIRSVAATMTLLELQQNRQSFIKNVEDTLKDGLSTNGLALEHASLVKLDQTDIKYFNPNNAFDAEGLTAITKITSQRRQERNDIEQETEVKIAQQNRDAQVKKFSIEREQTQAQVEQEKQIANMRAASRAEVSAREAEAAQAEQTAKITSEQNVSMAEQDRNIALAEKSRETAAAQAAAREAEAAAAKAKEAVITASQVAVAERESKIKVIVAEQDARSKAVAVTVQAEAEREAANNRALAIIADAKAKAEAAQFESEAITAKATAEAEGILKLNEAKNAMHPSLIEMQIKMKMLEVLPEIIRSAVDPIRNIGTVSIVDTGNGMPFNGQTVEGETIEGNNPMDRFMSSVMRYRFQAPVIDRLLKDAGFTVDGNGDMVSSMINGAIAGTASGTAAASVKPTEDQSDKVWNSTEEGKPA